MTPEQITSLALKGAFQTIQELQEQLESKAQEHEQLMSHINMLENSNLDYDNKVRELENEVERVTNRNKTLESFNQNFDSEQFEFTELWLTLFQRDFEDVDDMFIQASEDWELLQEIADDQSSFYNQASEFLTKLKEQKS